MTAQKHVFNDTQAEYALHNTTNLILDCDIFQTISYNGDNRVKTINNKIKK